MESLGFAGTTLTESQRSNTLGKDSDSSWTSGGASRSWFMRRSVLPGLGEASPDSSTRSTHRLSVLDISREASSKTSPLRNGLLASTGIR